MLLIKALRFVDSVKGCVTPIKVSQVRTKSCLKRAITHTPTAIPPLFRPTSRDLLHVYSVQIADQVRDEGHSPDPHKGIRLKAGGVLTTAS